MSDTKPVAPQRRRRARQAWGLGAVAFALLGVGLVIGHSDVTYAAYVVPIGVSFSAVGSLLSSQRPENPVGWLLLAFGLSACFNYVAEQYAHRALVTHPGSLAGGDIAASIAAHSWHASFGLLVFSFLLFPNGHLPSPRWRWIAFAAAFIYVGLAISGPFDSDFLHDDIRWLRGEGPR